MNETRWMVDIDEIAATLELLPGALRTLLAPYDHAVVSARPEPGEWCVLEVVGHLVTCDTGAFRDRIDGLVNGASEVPAFDAGAALVELDPMNSTLGELLDQLEVVRAESVAFVRSLAVDSLSAAAPFRGEGMLAASDFLLEWPYHDQDHIRQILDAVQRHYLVHMGATMRSALTGA